MTVSTAMIRWTGGTRDGVEQPEILDVHADGRVVLERMQGVLPGDAVGRFAHRADADLDDLTSLAAALLALPSDLDVPRQHRWVIVRQGNGERTLGVPLGETPGHPAVKEAEDWRQRLRADALSAPLAAIQGRWRTARPLPGAERHSLVVELVSVGTDAARVRVDPTGVTVRTAGGQVFRSSGMPASGGLVSSADLGGDGFREVAAIPAGAVAAASFGDVLPDESADLAVHIDGSIEAGPGRTERFHLVAQPPRTA